MKFENRPSSLIVGLTPASDKEMNVFGKICQIAEHGASYDENWKALGYDVPKNGFFSGFFQTEQEKKAQVLYTILLDRIINIGFKVTGIKVVDVDSYLVANKMELKNRDLQECWRRWSCWNETVEYRFEREHLSTNDAEKLENVLKFIEYSYKEVFQDIFKDFKPRKHYASGYSSKNPNRRF